jgi:RNA polymerase sigma-70 factor, ECF subfamily
MTEMQARRMPEPRSGFPDMVEGRLSSSSPLNPPPSGRSEAVRKILDDLHDGVRPEEAFRRLFDLYSSPLYRFFARRGFSPEDCRELTQETFLGIYTGIGSFRGEAGFETWMWKIATNAYRKRWRWRSAGKRAGEEVPLDGPEETAVEALSTLLGPAEEALGRERSRILREAIDKLPAQMRRCLVLRVDQDLKYREIAAVLRLSPETVKAHLFQARKRLEEELRDYFHDHDALSRLEDP